MILRQQQLRRVADLAKPVLPHLVNTQFGRTAKAVLDAAQDTVHIMLVPLKLEHGVYDVFQYLRTGNAAFFVDMPDQ